jgi:hypothetical protein
MNTNNSLPASISHAGGIHFPNWVVVVIAAIV